jgi:hypothetical protein
VPIISGVDYARHEVNIVCVGPVRLADVLGHAQQEKAEGALGFSRFIDMRGAGLEWDEAEARQIAERVRELSRETPQGPAAFVVSSDEAFDKMCAMDRLLEGSSETRTFRDEAEARAWLAAKTHARGASPTPSMRGRGLPRS